MKRNLLELNERNDHVVELYKAGFSFAEISRRYNITPERVRTIIRRAEWYEQIAKENRLKGTFLAIEDLKHIRRGVIFAQKFNGLPDTDSVKDLLQKIDNLIEVYSDV